MSRVKRIVLAFIVAPIAPALLQALYVGSLMAIPGVALASYAFVVLLGGPCFYIFFRLGWLKPWQIVSAAAALGVASYAILASFTECLGGCEAPWVMYGIATFLFYGALVGIAFWLIAGKELSANNVFQPTNSRCARIRG